MARSGIWEENMATKLKKLVKYETTSIGDVPHSRNGKHHGFISSILADLESLKPGMAMKIPLKELRHSKEKIRSALNHQQGKDQRRHGQRRELPLRLED
jgi:hypothetical protein